MAHLFIGGLPASKPEEPSELRVAWRVARVANAGREPRDDWENRPEKSWENGGLSWKNPWKTMATCRNINQKWRFVMGKSSMVAILLVTACDLKIRRNPDFPFFPAVNLKEYYPPVN